VIGVWPFIVIRDSAPKARYQKAKAGFGSLPSAVEKAARKAYPRPRIAKQRRRERWKMADTATLVWDKTAIGL
jgi:hypothetical protein